VCELRDLWEAGWKNTKCFVGQISEEEIKQRLADSLPAQDAEPEDAGWRRAAVLIPLLCVSGEWHLLFTRRTERVPHHKGQVSFPGGAYEASDHDLVETALRESCEEIGLQPGDVRILGRMDGLQTVSNYVVTPIVGRIIRPFAVELSVEEVGRAFTIPVAWLAEESHRQIRPYHTPDGRVFDVIYYDLYDGELLWGATAYITVTLLKQLGLTKFEAG
jgi:8-oxo-dGTP pyrophosphatase MutT (NUDIX family)